MNSEAEVAFGTWNQRSVSSARTLGAKPIHTLLVGCEPTIPGAGEDYEEMQMGLSEPVQAAVDEAVKMIDSLVEKLVSAEM